MADQLTAADVLSVLNQWELELTQRENERRSLKYVRGVMEAFQSAQTTLTSLREEEASLRSRCGSMALHCQEQERHAHEECQAKKAEMQRVLDKAQTDLSNTLHSLASADSALRDKERVAEKRLADLTHAMTEKEAALASVKKSFDAFIVHHGLGQAK